MNRRGFLTGIIAACAAPAIIRTPGLIMPIKPLKVSDGVALYPVAHPEGDLTQAALEEILMNWYRLHFDRPKNLIMSAGNVKFAQRLLAAA